METNSITNIILLVAIVFIAIGVTREQQQSQPIKETIRYIPRSLEEEAKEPVKVGDIFKSMFENQAPWIGNFNDKNVFLRKTLDKERDMLTNSKKKEKKLKISGNTVNTLSDEKISKMNDQIKKLTETIKKMNEKTSRIKKMCIDDDSLEEPSKSKNKVKEKSQNTKKTKKASKKQKKKTSSKKKRKQNKIDPNDINENDKRVGEANKINLMSLAAIS
jgi:hypothetical protein